MTERGREIIETLFSLSVLGLGRLIAIIDLSITKYELTMKNMASLPLVEIIETTEDLSLASCCNYFHYSFMFQIFAFQVQTLLPLIIK